jgi:hypothetical protein
MQEMLEYQFNVKKVGNSDKYISEITELQERKAVKP